MFKADALRYLGYVKGSVDPKIESLIDECILEIQTLANPTFIHQSFTLSHNPLVINELNLTIEYSDLVDLFDSCDKCLIVACSLGIDVDKKLRYYSKIDMTKMTILDAVASSYIEHVCDNFEAKLNLSLRTFRFCPGYGNVPLSLNKTLANALNTSKHIGLTVQDNDIMLPQKSMIGIIGIGDNKMKKHCFSCIKKNDCEFRKVGQRCYKQN